MRNTVSLCKDKCSFISVAPPCPEDMIRKISYFCNILTGKTDNRHRPFYNSGLNILKARYNKASLYRSLCHGELIVSTLEMLVCKDGTTDYGKVSIGTHKIVRELTDKIEKLQKCALIDLHRGMFGIQNDAMLVVVNIW